MTRQLGIKTSPPGAVTVLDSLQIEPQGMVIYCLEDPPKVLVRGGISYSGNANSLLTYTAPSAKYVMNSSGTLVSASTLRCDHSAIGVPQGLLVEEARTNLSQRSEEFDNAFYTKQNASISANSVAAPDGTTTADTFTASAGNAVHNWYSSSTSITNGANHAYSIFVKKNTHRYVGLGIPVASNTWVNAVFDLDGGGSTATQTGAGATSGTVVSTSQISMGNSWYRLTLVFNIASNSASIALQFCAAATGNTFGGFGDITYNAAGTESVYNWGAQLELGSFATSYIKTVAATVTRAIDNISLTSSSFPYSATLGNVTAAFNVQAVGATIVPWSLSDGTANERIQSFAHTGSHFFMVDGGVTQDDIDAGTVSASTTTKVSTAWQVNDTGASIAGAAAVAGDGTATIPTMTTLRLMNRYDGTVAASGYLRYLKYLPRRISNANLATESA